MSLLSTPLWSLAHIAIKFPLISLIAAGSYAYMADSQPRPIIAVTFDDGWSSVHNVALPYMREKGIVGTNYINPGAFTYDGYINAEQMMDFVHAGWEIGSHGVDHTDMTTLSEAELQTSLVKSQSILSGITGQPVTSFASPYGAVNDTTLEHISAVYDNHVNAVGWADGHGINYLDLFNYYNLSRVDITAEISAEMVCEQISELPENSLYVILFHRITDLEGRFNTTPATFMEIMDCVDNANADVLTVTEAVERMKSK